jgi:hypothetical protein
MIILKKRVQEKSLKEGEILPYVSVYFKPQGGPHIELWKAAGQMGAEDFIHKILNTGEGYVWGDKVLRVARSSFYTQPS